MAWLREWLLGVIAAALAVSLLCALVPGGALRSIARLAGGLVLLLAILRPAAELDAWDLRWRWQSWEEAVDQEITAFAADNQAQMAAIIEAQTGAYISEKAAALGCPCRVQVTTELREGIPYPCGAAMDIPYHAALSRWIARELAIGEEAQQWKP